MFLHKYCQNFHNCHTKIPKGSLLCISYQISPLFIITYQIKVLANPGQNPLPNTVSSSLKRLKRCACDCREVMMMMSNNMENVAPHVIKNVSRQVTLWWIILPPTHLVPNEISSEAVFLEFLMFRCTAWCRRRWKELVLRCFDTLLLVWLELVILSLTFAYYSLVGEWGWPDRCPGSDWWTPWYPLSRWSKVSHLLSY